MTFFKLHISYFNNCSSNNENLVTKKVIYLKIVKLLLQLAKDKEQSKNSYVIYNFN